MCEYACEVVTLDMEFVDAIGEGGGGCIIHCW